MLVIANININIGISISKSVGIKKELYMEKTLKKMRVGEKAVISKIAGEGAIKRRLMDMGVTRGTEVLVRKVAPFGDPIEINLRGYELTLRKAEADNIFVQALA
jgi:ferrous iron transport protein A